MKGLNTPAVQMAVLFFGLSAFVLVFGAYGFIAPWGGDINVHLAAVHALYRNMWNPSDISLDVKSGYAVFYSPYTVLVALAGKGLGITPYRAFEIAAVCNLALYAFAIALFCRTYSAVPKSPWPPLLFLIVSLFLRSKVYAWSSETSYLTLGITQAYPSLVGWSLALLAFVAMEHAAQKRSIAAIAGLACLIALQMLIHPLTASWTIGIVGLRALYLFAMAAAEQYREGRLALTGLRGTLTASLVLAAALALGIGLSLLWPYYSPIGLAKLAGLQQNDAFGSDPFGGIPMTYLLAVGGLLVTTRLRVYWFWIAAFVATFGAFELFRALGMQLADRYVFFMGFFAQFIVADCAAVALTLLSGTVRNTRLPQRWKISNGVYLVLLALALLYAPAIHAPMRSGILSTQAWRQGTSGERAFYGRWQPLTAAISPGEVLMMPPAFEESFAIPAVTGAKVITAIGMDPIADAAERADAVQHFFTAGQNPEVRLNALKRWRATKVVLIAPVLDLAGEMEALFGPPIWRDEKRLVFAAAPEGLLSGANGREKPPELR